MLDPLSGLHEKKELQTNGFSDQIKAKGETKDLVAEARPIVEMLGIFTTPVFKAVFFRFETSTS